MSYIDHQHIKRVSLLFLLTCSFCVAFGTHAGILSVPLPAESTVTGFGLDVRGQMVDAVAVEKTTSRAVYEKEVRSEQILYMAVPCL